VYPYHAGSTKMDNLLPPWMHDGGVAKLLARLADRATRRRVVEECLIDGERWRTPMGSIGFDQIFVATCSRPELEGLDLAHLGRATGGTPAEAMLSLVAEERAGVSMVVFSQSEDNVAKVLAHPAVMIGSDSLGLSAGPGPHPGKPHPRMYGTFPRVLGVYARDAPRPRGRPVERGAAGARAARRPRRSGAGGAGGAGGTPAPGGARAAAGGGPDRLRRRDGAVLRADPGRGDPGGARRARGGGRPARPRAADLRERPPSDVHAGGARPPGRGGPGPGVRAPLGLPRRGGPRESRRPRDDLPRRLPG